MSRRLKEEIRTILALHQMRQPYKDIYHANKQARQTTTLEANQDICKGSQTSQAAPTIPTPTTPTIEARD